MPWNTPPVLRDLYRWGKVGLGGLGVLGSAIYDPLASASEYLTGIPSPRLMDENLKFFTQAYKEAMGIPEKPKAKPPKKPPPIKNQGPLPPPTQPAAAIQVPSAVGVTTQQTTTQQPPATTQAINPYIAAATALRVPGSSGIPAPLPEILPTPSRSYTGPGPTYKPQAPMKVDKFMGIGDFISTIANQKMAHRAALANYYNSLASRQSISVGSTPYIGFRNPEAMNMLLDAQIRAQEANLQKALAEIAAYPVVANIWQRILGVINLRNQQ